MCVYGLEIMPVVAWLVEGRADSGRIIPVAFDGNVEEEIIGPHRESGNCRQGAGPRKRRPLTIPADDGFNVARPIFDHDG
jgi:hypothetical protein